MSVVSPSPASLSPDAVTANFEEEYEASVNPQWVRLLRLLQMNVRYARCAGVELFTGDGNRVLDFLSGYCVHNLGHNHPAILQAIKDELDRCGPAMLQSHVPERAGELATRLCHSAGGNLTKVFFCSSGSEGIEAAIKFARAHTRRNGLLYTEGAFHGLTCGALSLMGDAFWKTDFGPLLPETDQIRFNHLSDLEEKLKTRNYAVFFVEPIQGEGGIHASSAEYLKQARELCERYGTLLVFDEVQTGFCRTGPFLAAHHYSVNAHGRPGKSDERRPHPERCCAHAGRYLQIGLRLLQAVLDSYFHVLRKRPRDASRIGCSRYARARETGRARHHSRRLHAPETARGTG